MEPDPVDGLTPDPSQPHPPGLRRDFGEGGGGHWAPRRPSRLRDGDEVRISPDAAAMAAGERPAGLLASLAFWLEARLSTLRRAMLPGPPPAPTEAPRDEERPRVAPLPRQPTGAERRVHERFDSADCTVRIDSTLYEVLDVSLGGFTFGPDRGLLIANQRFYFELRFPGDHPGDPVRADGKVVRVGEGVIAAKFFLPLATTRRLIAAFVAHHRDTGRDVGRDTDGGAAPG